MSNVFVAGHKGLVGSAICRRLAADGVEPLVASRAELDLTDQSAVDAWFSDNEVDQVYLAAAKVGGIHANDTYPAEFLRDKGLDAGCFHAGLQPETKKSVQHRFIGGQELPAEGVDSEAYQTFVTMQMHTAEKDLAHALELGRKCGIALPAAGVVAQDMARIYRVKDAGRR